MKKQLLITPQQLKPSHPDFEILGVFNPAVIKHQHQTIMIVRVAESLKNGDASHVFVPIYRYRKFSFIKINTSDTNYDFSDRRVIKNHKQNYLTSISHFRVARSHNGIDFTFDDTFILPDTMYEEYGIEDPRITFIEGRYYITYTAVSSNGINVALMVTDDFYSFERLGIIFPFDNKDCVIFPEKIGEYYYAYHRPSTSDFGRLDIWMARSKDLLHWGDHQVVTSARIDYMPSARIGAGSVPFLTNQGWMSIYHSADLYHRYHLLAMVSDKNDPKKIILRSNKPLISPTEPFEIEGFQPHVVFTCGLTQDNNILNIYYGACDQSIALCQITMDEIIENLGEVR